MQITVNQSELKGNVKVPSSKSQTIRALMCAALSKGESVLENPLVCEDTDAAAEVLGKVGIDIQRGDGSWRMGQEITSVSGSRSDTLPQDSQLPQPGVDSVPTRDGVGRQTERRMPLQAYRVRPVRTSPSTETASERSS